MYALCKLLYLHKPWRFSDFSILLCSVFECDVVSMSFIICLVCSNVVSAGVMFSLGGQFTLIHVALLFESAFVGCKFAFLGNWKTDKLSCKGMSVIAGVQMSIMLGVFIDLVLLALIVLSELLVPMSDIRIVLCNLCVTCCVVSSIISSWSVSNSELDWAEIELLASRVLWHMGGGNLSIVGV